MKEIGGYLELDEFRGEEYYPEAIAVNSACNGLEFLLKARNIQKLYIPYYLCDSVAELCEREHFQIEFYSIYEDFSPNFSHSLKDGEYLYVVNYFGYLDDTKILDLKKRFDRIILDNVQAFFHKPLYGIDTIYSCRKFFGVPDGGYVMTNAVLNEEIPSDLSMNRMQHILGRYDVGKASDFYADFLSSENTFRKLELRWMSRLTHNLLKAIDYEKVRKKREENYTFLAKQLNDANRLLDNSPIGPYMYPFYCPNGMEIKKKLAIRKIYIPTLWPNVLKYDHSLEKDYAENILPLPIDQRYRIEDMQYIVKELKNVMKN